MLDDCFVDDIDFNDMPPSNRCRDETLISSDESDDDDRSRRNRKTFISKRYKEASIGATRFEDIYSLTDEVLGQGAYARVVTCVSLITGKDFAVKIIEKRPGHSRVRIIKEIELFHLCVGHPNIVQLVEYFEENDKFYLIFEKMHGGSLLGRIQRKICFSEEEARGVVRDIANGLKFLHDNGVAHRDLKPENLLCSRHDSICPVKLCDLDLASKIFIRHQHSDSDSITTPELQSPVGSAEFMAPEVVGAFMGRSLSYDKRCDLWSLGVILYILLCGYPPFYGECSLSDCGWNNGQPCSDCQETLFNRIQVGHFEFPTDDWEDRSEQVKDLIRHLLTTDVNSRYTVDELLRHPFLAAASVVRRTNSGYNLLNPPGHLQDDYCIQQSLSGLKLSAGVAAEDLAARVVMSRPVWISVPSNCEQNP